MRVRVFRASLLSALAAALVSAPVAHAQTTDVVVGVPIQNGKAGKPQPGVIVDLEGKQRRDPVPTPVIVQELAGPGKTTVQPKFGGGYTVENEDGSKTEVKPIFGGGYTVEKQGPTAKPR
jgi:hypothetical protein